MLRGLLLSNPTNPSCAYPSGLLNLCQSELTQLFLREALATGLVTIHFQAAVEPITDRGEDEVVVTARDPATDLESTYTASYLVTMVPAGDSGSDNELLSEENIRNYYEKIMSRSDGLLTLYSDERRRVFQSFVDPTTTANKLRMQQPFSTPESARYRDSFFRILQDASPMTIERLVRQFFETWPTDMRATPSKHTSRLFPRSGPGYLVVVLQHRKSTSNTEHTTTTQCLPGLGGREGGRAQANSLVSLPLNLQSGDGGPPG
ncbi:hypothetical protein BJX65DRAFT_310495 [Aspergillus insuetus]